MQHVVSAAAAVVVTAVVTPCTLANVQHSRNDMAEVLVASAVAVRPSKAQIKHQQRSRGGRSSTVVQKSSA